MVFAVGPWMAINKISKSCKNVKTIIICVRCSFNAWIWPGRNLVQEQIVCWCSRSGLEANLEEQLDDYLLFRKFISIFCLEKVGQGRWIQLPQWRFSMAISKIYKSRTLHLCALTVSEILTLKLLVCEKDKATKYDHRSDVIRWSVNDIFSIFYLFTKIRHVRYLADLLIALNKNIANVVIHRTFQ